MKIEFVNLKMADIDMGNRRREDYGDIEKLADGIRKVGLLQPLIVRRVDGRFHIVAGGRRFKAIQILGWDSVDVRRYETLTDDEVRDIELEENDNRKDFTDTERRRTFTASKQTLADAKKACAILDTRYPKMTGKKGRPKNSASVQAVADAIGVNRATIQRAEKHVETAENFPFMRGWRQSEVLAAREKLENIPEAERDDAVGVITCAKLMDPATAVELLENIAAKTSTKRVELYGLSKSEDPRDRSKALSYAAELPPLADPRINAVESALAALSRATNPYPHDPLTPEFLKVAGELRRLKKLVEAVSYDARRVMKEGVIQ